MKLILVLVVMVGSAVCEPPAHNGYGSYATAVAAPAAYAAPVSPVAYAPAAYAPTSLLSLSESLLGANSPTNLLVAAAPHTEALHAGPAATYGAPVGYAYSNGLAANAYAAPVVKAPVVKAPVVNTYVAQAPLVSTYVAEAPLVSSYVAKAPVASYVAKAPAHHHHHQHHSYAPHAPVYSSYVAKEPLFSKYVSKSPSHYYKALSSPILKASVGVVKARPLVQAHHYDHTPFKPIIKKPVYSSSYEITPSISYGYSYKLVPTGHYGPVVSHVPEKHVHAAPLVRAPLPGKTKHFNLNFGLDVGHPYH